MIKSQMEIQSWPIERFIPYGRNPRKNDAAVDRMCASIREFGFKCPVLVRSSGNVVDGHLRLKSARKLGSWPGPAARHCVSRRVGGRYTRAQRVARLACHIPSRGSGADRKSVV